MIAGEAMLFLLSCLIGVGFGAVYDFFRAFRLIFPAGKKAAFIEDGLFFLLFAAVNFLFFLDRSFGRLRLFLLIGEGLGFTVYYFTAGKAVYFILGGVIGGVRGLALRIFRHFFRKKDVKNVEGDENPAKRPGF